ncbi:hypothetical protein E3P92_00359 [Wallemia ichthyophaga]|uniref:Uncharacterized protein n=1 Tax=Wallemia ichthyophaga TaxID=245174 RepID=A0A4T0F2Z6_WALIC|nr:hypothetical protein E3P91_00715 [Wallemia ichthyophaga]TIA81629.1 hypothetical protein E3P98_01895 [Wallemia ichthyophaga]TIB03822.1 hypothetical protein E3P95_00424 [Wallemia ichthyophaga]TIB04955.1 hypothetical protein E3P94_00424 [Wallemia ichthyophaga]TIB13808.1 hypothetical protein E3P93_01810 [Wallemia ichthyophaga]
MTIRMPDPNRQMLVAQKQRKPRNRRQIQQPESNEGADHPPSADPELAFNIALRESWEKDARDCLSLEERLNRDKLRRQAGEDLLRDLVRKRNEANPPPLYSPPIRTPAYEPAVRTPAYAPPLPPRTHHTHHLRRSAPPLPPRRNIPG